MRDALEVSGLSKVYKNGTVALSNVDLKVRKGELHAVIGRNGAGKTTMIRILTTQLMPTSGSATVMGIDVVSNPAEVRKHIALVPQEAQTNQSMSPWDYVYYLTMLEGISSTEAKTRSLEALELVGLSELARKPCYALSGGEKRRAIVAAAVASKADVLFLDEPSTGMDPIIRRQIWGALRKMVEKGQTIILTTHLMDEAEFVSDRISIMDGGKVVTTGTLDEIRGKMKAKARVVIGGNGNHDFASYGEVVTLGDRQILYLDDPNAAGDVVSSALKDGFSAEVSRVTLEDVFHKVLGGVAE